MTVCIPESMSKTTFSSRFRACLSAVMLDGLAPKRSLCEIITKSLSIVNFNPTSASDVITILDESRIGKSSLLINVKPVSIKNNSIE
jgi:hypothetical protein